MSDFAKYKQFNRRHFRKKKWSDVLEGDVVYQVTTTIRNNKEVPIVEGPFEVFDLEDRLLRVLECGTIVSDLTEDLCVPK
jgi:hypothetical protein